MRFLPARRFLSASSSTPSYASLLGEASELHASTVSVRRTLHRKPELMYQEKETSALVQQTLSDLGIRFTTGWGVNTRPERFTGPGGYGVVAEIGDAEGPCVMLRADMDALPIAEAASVDFRSEVDGCMHACGHDGHTSMLLSAARLLKAHEAAHIRGKGAVRLMFQPAEEGGAGAKRMIEEGVLAASSTSPAPGRVFGFHLWPTLPAGHVAGRAGVQLAASDSFRLTLKGVGGHAAMPHLAKDPIVAVAALVQSLQSLISRELSPLDCGVVSVTKIVGGDATNVIPETVHVAGTLRALSVPALDQLRERMREMMTQILGVHGCTIELLAFAPDPYPPTVNDAALWESFVRPTAAAASSTGAVENVATTMAGEDFGFVANEVPSAFLLLGQGSGPGGETSHGLHHPQFTMDEAVLDTGVALHTHLALASLAEMSRDA